MVRYKELDSLRGIASLIVVLFHFSMHREQQGYGFNLGVTGVDLFFIISGFVIVMSTNHIKSTIEFIINRFTRLYPTYWACVTVSFLLQLFFGIYFKIGMIPSFEQYLGNMTMFQHYLNISNIEGAYWSMIIEMLFYIIIAIIISLKLIKQILPISLLLAFLIILQFILPGTVIWPYYFKFRGLFPLLNHFFLFVAGIIFYKIKTEKENHFLLYVLLIFVFAFQSQQNGGSFVSNTEYVIMLTMFFLSFLLFVNGRLSFIISRPTLFFGKISFALYLIHQYMSTELILPYLIDKCHINYWVAAVITIIVVIFIATIITSFVEIPLGKKMNTILRKVFKLPPRNKVEIIKN